MTKYITISCNTTTTGHEYAGVYNMWYITTRSQNIYKSTTPASPMNSAPTLQMDDTCTEWAAEIGVDEGSGTTSVTTTMAVPEADVGGRRGMVFVKVIIEAEVTVGLGEVVTEPITVVGVAEVVVVTDEDLVEDPVVTDADDLVEPLLWVPDDAVVEALFEADADCVMVVVTVVDADAQDAINAPKASLAAFLSSSVEQTFCEQDAAPGAKPGCAQRHAWSSREHPAEDAPALAQFSAQAGRGPNLATARPMVRPSRTTSALRGAK
jgi:hypothetical protein